MNRLTYITKGIINTPKNMVYRARNKPLLPRWIVLMTTDKCNSRCSHCNIWQQKPTEQPLGIGEIYEFLSSPLNRKLEVVLNTGGECTLNNDLATIIRAEHFALPNADIQISTNALLPDRVVSLVKELEQDNICVLTGTSIDGIGEAHDKIRGVPGNFEKLNYMIKQFDDRKMVLGFTLSDLTIDNLDDVIWYAKLMNKDLIIQWCNNAEFYHKEEQPVDNTEKFKQIIKTVDMKMLGNLLIKNAWLRLLDGKSIKFPCFALQTFYVLKCNGDIVPCLSMWNDVAGNIRESGYNFEKIWYGSKANEIRNKVKKCEGCLNFWGFGWSMYSAFYYYAQYLKNPKELFRILGGKK